MTTIEIPDFVTIVEPRSMPELVALVGELFSDEYGLPVPRYITVSDGAQEAAFQFGHNPETFHVMARWADRFGGTITGEPGTDESGGAQVRCQVAFTFKGMNVRAYAYITAGQASTT